MNEFAQGFLLGFSLLAALGPKDVFVIKNSLSGKNAMVLVAICSLSDALLIILGVVGLGAIVSSTPWLLKLTMATGIMYLLYFGLRAIRSAFHVPAAPLKTSAPPDHAAISAEVVSGALFHSLLTPYAWIDTVLVIGAVSVTMAGPAKYAFAGGAMTASLIWFVLLTTGSRWAAPMLGSRRAWQVLDLIVAASMFMLCYQLAAETNWTTS